MAKSGVGWGIMKQLTGNEILTAFSIGDYCLSGAEIKRIDIYTKEEELELDVYIDLSYSRFEKHVQLKFSEVSAYSLVANPANGFRRIEQYKFNKCNGLYYICFDPVAYNPGILTQDQDYILCKQVKAFLAD
jgi:hypothetical protein